MKVAIIIAFVLGLGGVGAILLASELGGSYQRLESLDSLFEDDADGKRVAIELTITSIQSATKPLEFVAHRLTKEGEVASLDERTIRVIYDGNDKINVERNSSVFAEGRWDAESKTLIATKVSTKCPSRYNAEAKTSSTPKP